MVDYPLSWITANLAVGHAPMSYAELDSIRDQGIDAILNLCGEFCDLHEIEQTAGFEVYFLPVIDERAPDMAEMEHGLAWLDEAVYLGKKVLVHCRHGIGRTGTFITAYLLRRGFSLKEAGRMLKSTRATPTNFSQWWLLKKFGRKEGRLVSGQPQPHNREYTGLEPFFSRYRILVESLQQEDALLVSEPQSCTCRGTQPRPLFLELIEALYLHTRANIVLHAELRAQLIDQLSRSGPTDVPDDLAATEPCPLLREGSCLLWRFRPIRCRIDAAAIGPERLAAIQQELAELSREVFLAVFDFNLDEPPCVHIKDVLSGRFIQIYFHHIAALKAALH